MGKFDPPTEHWEDRIRLLFLQSKLKQTRALQLIMDVDLLCLIIALKSLDCCRGHPVDGLHDAEEGDSAAESHAAADVADHVGQGHGGRTGDPQRRLLLLSHGYLQSQARYAVSVAGVAVESL